MGVRAEAIDIIKLYTEGDAFQWNAFLDQCVRRQDIKTLADVYRRLQMGMTDTSKMNMNAPKVIDVFIRWQRSIEKTIEQIWWQKFPLPPVGHLDYKPLKTKRRNELEHFLAKMRF